MLFTTTSPVSVAGLLSLLLAAPQPSEVLAAPQVGLAVPEAVAVDLVGRSLDPHYSCYSGGETLSGIGSLSKVDSIVKSACGTFATYDNHKFVVGSTVQWCTTVPFGTQGLHNNIVLMMKYKGEAASFTPLSKNYQGGLQQYCHTAMQWALDNCNHGGYFENHKIGSGANGIGWQYWDVKVDPNSGSCADNQQ